MESLTDDVAGETRIGPPLDDCCPICFGSFSVPCRSDCGHWYCASCILQYWNYSSAPKTCKCPMCSHHINMLMPEASLCQPSDEDVAKVLENIRRYNGLFVGGIRGMVQKVLPLFIKRIFREMMNPDRRNSYVHEMRLFAVKFIQPARYYWQYILFNHMQGSVAVLQNPMLPSILYTATQPSPFDFTPSGENSSFKMQTRNLVFTIVVNHTFVFTLLVTVVYIGL